MTEPPWWRYRDDRDALMTIVMRHGEQIERDPANAAWYRQDIAEIEAHLRRSAA